MFNTPSFQHWIFHNNFSAVNCFSIHFFTTFAFVFRKAYTKILKSMSKKELITYVEEHFIQKPEFPTFKAGDTITIHYKIKEGDKERIQQFQGVVLQRAGHGLTETFTVRKVSGTVGVERIIPIGSPFIDKIELNKRGAVRRSRIFYLRDLKGKKARIKEKRY